VQAIERDFDNIRLAWEWSAKNQHLTHLHTMCNGLYLFGFLGSRYREIITLFQQSLDQSVADAPLRGRLLARRWGFLHWWHQEDYQEAFTSIEQALTIARAENNQFELAFCHLMAAYALNNMQRYADALPHLESSQALFEALDKPYYVCWVLHRLGYVYLSLNNSARANEYTEQRLRQRAAVLCGSITRHHRVRASGPNRPCVQFVSLVCLLSRRLHHLSGLCRAFTGDH
jgi:tetratricopeptide (TPR) repeat protein